MWVDIADSLALQEGSLDNGSEDLMNCMHTLTLCIRGKTQCYLSEVSMKWNVPQTNCGYVMADKIDFMLAARSRVYLPDGTRSGEDNMADLAKICTHGRSVKNLPLLSPRAGGFK